MCTALDELVESGKEKLLIEMVEKKLAKNKLQTQSQMNWKQIFP